MLRCNFWWSLIKNSPTGNFAIQLHFIRSPTWPFPPNRHCQWETHQIIGTHTLLPRPPQQQRGINKDPAKLFHMVPVTSSHGVTNRKIPLKHPPNAWNALLQWKIMTAAEVHGGWGAEQWGKQQSLQGLPKMEWLQSTSLFHQCLIWGCFIYFNAAASFSLKHYIQCF